MKNLPRILRFQDQWKRRWWRGMVGQLPGVEGGAFFGEMRVVVMGENGDLWILCGEDEVKEVSDCW